MWFLVFALIYWLGENEHIYLLHQNLFQIIIIK